MHTSSSTRIRALTEAGYWGSETLHSILAARVADSAGSVALVDQPNKAELTGLAARCLNFHDLDTLSDSFAAQLLGLGLQQGDKLLVQLPNISELVLCYYAASKLGVVISPIPIQYGGHEIARFADTLKPAAMLTLGRFRDIELAAQAREALTEIPVWTLGIELQCEPVTDPVLLSNYQEHRNQHPDDAKAFMNAALADPDSVEVRPVISGG